MNWSEILTEILSSSGTDEAKAFFLGVGLAAGVRIVRAGLVWLKRVDSSGS